MQLHKSQCTKKYVLVKLSIVFLFSIILLQLIYTQSVEAITNDKVNSKLHTIQSYLQDRVQLETSPFFTSSTPSHYFSNNVSKSKELNFSNTSDFSPNEELLSRGWSPLAMLRTGPSKDNNDDDNTSRIQLQISMNLSQTTVDTLHNTLLEVSSPHSLNYGRHLSSYDITKIIHSDSNHYLNQLEILRWLSAYNLIDTHGINTLLQSQLKYRKRLYNPSIFPTQPQSDTHSQSSHLQSQDSNSHHNISVVGSDPDKTIISFNYSGDILSVTTSIRVAQTLLQTKYQPLVNQNGNIIHRTAGYTVPQKLSSIISFITPTIHLPLSSIESDELQMSNESIDSSPRLHNLNDDFPLPTMDPIRIKNEYGSTNFHVNSDTPSPETRTTVAIANFHDESYNTRDLLLFLHRFSPESLIDGIPKVTIIGKNNPTKPTREASLDIQAVAAMAPGADIEFWSIPGPQPGTAIPDNEPFLELLLQFQENKHKPIGHPLASTLSISYGDDETTVTPSYLQRVNIEFMKVGLRGVTVLVASGDGGVAGPHRQKCINGRFIPVFPASSPYVTAVGGTTSFPEMVASLSGGGFSNQFPIPSWQQNSINQYIQNAERDGVFPGDYFQRADIKTGAGYPELSAQAIFFPGIILGKKVAHEGTSVSCPIVASLIAIINDQLRQMNRRPVGFLNPMLYHMNDEFSENTYNSIFTDIMKGNNPGCDTNGFTAVQRWDPVSGLGTIKFKQFLQFLTQN